MWCRLLTCCDIIIFCLGKLKPLGDADLEEMLRIKEEEAKSSREEFDGKINMWDLRFVSEIIP